MLSISQRSLDYLIANKQLTTRRIGTRVLIALTRPPALRPRRPSEASSILTTAGSSLNPPLLPSFYSSAAQAPRERGAAFVAASSFSTAVSRCALDRCA